MWRLVDFFIPAPFADDLQKVVRGRCFVIQSALFGTIAITQAIFIIFHHPDFVPTRLLLIVGLIYIFVMPVLLRLTGQLDLLASLTIAVSIFAIFRAGELNASSFAPAAVFLPSIAISCTLLWGRIGMFAALAAIGPTIGYHYYLSAAGVPTLAPYSDTERVFLTFQSLTISVVAVCVLAYLHKQAVEHISIQLERAKDKEAAASRAKSDFLANMSHEIRTPMNGVLGLLTALQFSRLDEEQQRQVTTAKSSAEALLAMLNDILDESKIESGTADLHLTEFNLVAVSNNVVETLRPNATQKGLDISVEVDPSIAPRLIGDPIRTRQILFNLINNAVKFTDRGSVALTVTVVSDSEGQQLIEFGVHDQGSGIPAVEMDRIFDRFHRGGNFSDRQIAGAGLGLSIAKHLVNSMNGTIDVESVVGKGSHFRVRLPLDRLPSMPQPAASDSENSSRTGGNRLRILLAEDNQTNQMVLRKLIEHLGHELVIVENGHQAVTTAAQSKFDLILLDDRMPVMDGRSAAQTIRRSETPSADAPIIAVSANTEFRDEKKRAAYGINAFVEKPIKVADLFAAIKRATAV